MTDADVRAFIDRRSAEMRQEYESMYLADTFRLWPWIGAGVLIGAPVGVAVALVVMPVLRLGPW